MTGLSARGIPASRLSVAIGRAYSEGAREGARNAIQVADRFHLLKNLDRALERLLNRKRSILKSADPVPNVPEFPDQSEKLPVEVAPSSTLSGGEVADKVTLKPLNQAERDSQRRRLGRYLRYEQIRELFREGHSISEIFPERAPRTNGGSQLDAHKPYHGQRWRERCHNAHTLWKEVAERGYCGGYTMVKAYLRTMRQPSRPALGTPEATSTKAAPSVRDVVRALLRPEPKRSDGEKSLLERLDDQWEPFRRFRASAQSIMELVRASKVRDQLTALTEWIAVAQASNVADLVSFAVGIKKDQAAVVGLSLQWNNGPVEGSVNGLKMIKRQMYGRAGFALLRRRVLEPT
jgi:transposase